MRKSMERPAYFSPPDALRPLSTWARQGEPETHVGRRRNEGDQAQYPSPGPGLTSRPGRLMAGSRAGVALKRPERGRRRHWRARPDDAGVPFLDLACEHAGID